MAEIFIPEQVSEGFNIIASLPKKTSQQIANYLIAAPVTSTINTFLSPFNDFLSKKIGIEKSRELVETIVSFQSLLKDDSVEVVAKSLSDSYKEYYKPSIEEKLYNSLRQNLTIILNAYNNLLQTLKANDLLVEKENVYEKSKVLSDIRIVFSTDLNDKNRNAVIIHELHLSYRAQRQKKDFFISMDLIDLKELQKQIERAIAKEEIIKADYSNIKFI